MNKKLKWILIATGLTAVAFFYYNFNPSETPYFLRCPFKGFTGYDCPGCGSQRAVHQLLHGNLMSAFKFNPALISFIPYILLGAYFDLKSPLPPNHLKVRNLLYGRIAIYLVAGIITLFWIIRNLI